MKFIGFDREEDAIVWAKEVLGIENPVGFCRAFSAVDSEGRFAFVVILSNFTKRNIDMHTAAISGAQWASPRESLRMFNGIFDYAFRQLKAARVTGLVKSKNVEARRFDEHIGFKLEGVMREAFDDDDLCVYGFLASEYKAHPWYRSI